MAKLVFKATIHGVRTLPSRKVVQIVVEAPIEELAHIASVAEHGAWVAVARLEPPGKEEPDDKPARAKSLSQQAGALCANPVFRAFFGAATEDECAQRVREWCDVESRGEIKAGTRAGKAWLDLVQRFHGWEQAEKAGVYHP